MSDPAQKNPAAQGQKNSPDIVSILKKQSPYGIILLGVVLLIIAVIIMFMVYSKMMFACNLGRRKQETCGLEYMEAETIRYEFHKAYNSSVLKLIKVSWIMLMVSATLMIAAYILTSLIHESTGTKKMIHSMIGIVLIACVLSATIKLSMDRSLKVMQELQYGQIDATEKKKIFGMLIGMLGATLLVMWTVAFWFISKKSENDNDVNTILPVLLIAASLTLIVPAAILVFKLHIDLFNVNGSYVAAATALQNFLNGSFTPDIATMLRNYLAQNINRLEPNRAGVDGTDVPADAYKFVEHKDSQTMFDMVSTNLVPWYIYESKWTEFLECIESKCSDLEGDWSQGVQLQVLRMHVDRVMFALLGGIPQARTDYRFNKVDVANYLDTRVKSWNDVSTTKITTNPSTMDALPGSFTYRELYTWASEKAMVAKEGSSCDFERCPGGTDDCNTYMFWMHFPIYVVYQWRSDIFSGLSFDKRTMDGRVRNLMTAYTGDDQICKHVREKVLGKLMSNVMTTASADTVDFSGMKTQLAILRTKDEEILSSVASIRKVIIFFAIVLIGIPAYMIFHALYKINAGTTTIVTSIAIILCIVAITWYGWFMGALVL